MRLAHVIPGILALVPVGFFASVMIASELGGEVVVLRTRDPDGATLETRLWVVDHAERPWLRAGSADSGWLLRLQAQPRVELLRGGTSRSYLAIASTAERAAVSALMAEKYGFANTLVSLMRDERQTIPVRLSPE